MLRNVRVHSTHVNLCRAAAFLFVLATTTTYAQTAQEQYLAEQAHQALQLKRITNDLNRGASEPSRGDLQIFRRAIQANLRASDPNFEVVQRVLQYWIRELSNPAIRNDSTALRSIRDRIVSRAIKAAGRNAAGQLERERTRTLICEEILKGLRELLENNFSARTVAINLLPELLIAEPQRATRVQRVILPAAGQALVEVLQDGDQPDAVKLSVAQATRNLLAKVDPNDVLEMQLAVAISEELRNPLKAEGYQAFLLYALAEIDAPRDVQQTPERPVCFDCAADLMQDKRRTPLIRCIAAGLPGQVGFDDGINFEPLAWKVAQVAAEFGTEYNQTANSRPRNYWNQCALNLFLAFQHDPPDDNNTGMLNRAPRSTVVRAAWDHVLSVIAPIFKSPPGQAAAIDKGAIETTGTWVRDNQPEELSYDGGSPALQPLATE